MQKRDELLLKWLEQAGKTLGIDPATIEKASSDAGFRQYYRVKGTDGTYIIMDSPPEHYKLDPFIEVDELFAKAGVNVPVIYAKDMENGFLILSDMGKQTYLDVIDNDNANRLMSDATDALIKIQLASKEGVLPPYSEQKLREELELFPEWYLKRHLGWEITKEERSIIDKTFDLIIKKNLDQPSVYVHRDYMPRNLMLTEKDNPGVIDFQDALYGPISYDIASLCKDAFISWDESQVLDWTIRYWEKARKAGLPVREDFGAFWEDVEWMGIQRHLKVLGIFARINYRDGKEKYLMDTPRFLQYVKTTSHRYDSLKPLSRIIDKIMQTEEKVGYTF